MLVITKKTNNNLTQVDSVSNIWAQLFPIKLLSLPHLHRKDINNINIFNIQISLPQFPVLN